MGTIFTCSIDDGHPSDAKIAELLQRHNLNGTFYVPIKNREGAEVMSAAQLREIGRHFEIGSHTYDHCFLKELEPEQAKYQVVQGKQALEDLLGRRVCGFCYPGGKFRYEHTELVKAAGFYYARTTVNLCFDAGSNRFEIPTTCQFYPHARSVYLRNFARARRWMRRRTGLALAISQPNWIDRMYDLFDYACESSAVFHLWAHSRDIDRFDAWRDLDLFLEHVASRVPLQDRLNNEQLAARFF